MNLTPQQYGLHAEKEVKKILEQEFNTTFTKRKLVLGRKSNGEENKHEFDLVSDDDKIVVEIKSYINPVWLAEISCPCASFLPLGITN